MYRPFATARTGSLDGDGSAELARLVVPPGRLHDNLGAALEPSPLAVRRCDEQSAA